MTTAQLHGSARLDELQAIASRVRGKIVEIAHKTNTMHVGSSMSCADIVVAAYWTALSIDPSNPTDPDRDRFILSKGHAAPTLFASLAFRGFFPESLLETYDSDGGVLGEHPTLQCVPGVEASTGSLGHGLPLGVGMAMAGRIQGQSYRVFVVMSDGECNEGSVWEAAMLAASQRLERLIVVVDYNKWQATGRSNEVLALSPLREKWEAFGWTTHEIDGHDLGALTDLLGNVPDGSGRPIAIIANTVKGKGVSFMEDDNNWHYRSPNAAELEQARQELGLHFAHGQTDEFTRRVEHRHPPRR